MIEKNECYNQLFFDQADIIISALRNNEDSVSISLPVSLNINLLIDYILKSKDNEQLLDDIGLLDIDYNFYEEDDIDGFRDYTMLFYY